MKYSIIIFSVLFIFIYTFPVAYLYPVIPLDGANVLMCYQPNAENLELHLFNVTHQSMTKIVSSWYRTAAVRLLPDGSGISFVDNGIIRIKLFAKRSVKAVEIFEPLYGIDFIEWLNPTTCYFHAQSDGVFGIYSLSLDESPKRLVVIDGVDCMYPSIVDSVLFYIERRHVEGQTLYAIRCRNYKDDNPRDALLLSMDTKKIIFLYMVCETKGYFLEYRVNDDLVMVWYHCITYADGWCDTVLFTFSLPISFFSDGPHRLYESLLPFVPRHINNEIYYSSMSNEGKLHLYSFDPITTQTRCVVNSLDTLFAPAQVGNKLIVGSCLADEEVKDPIIVGI